MAQVALALILFTSAALMLKSFRRMTTYPAGFSPQKMLTARIALGGPDYDRQWPRQREYLSRLLEKTAQLPGVLAAGVDCGTMTQPLKLTGDAHTELKPITAGIHYVSADYLRAIGVPLRSGTLPETQDQIIESAVINEKLAAELGSVSLVGSRISGSAFSATIAAVVSDFKDRRLDAEVTPQVYLGYPLAPAIHSVRLLIRTSIPARALRSTLRESLAQIDPNVPVLELQTLDQSLSQSIAPRRFDFLVVAMFSGTALALALIGIYGMIAYLVTQRSAEIGIRMAIGATPADILAMVLRQSMGMIVSGILAGLGGALLLSKIIAAFLYGVRPNDVFTLAFGALLFGIADLAACLVPASKAACMSPLRTLRQE